MDHKSFFDLFINVNINNQLKMFIELLDEQSLTVHKKHKITILLKIYRSDKYNITVYYFY
jgi:hypothetical protein